MACETRRVVLILRNVSSSRWRYSSWWALASSTICLQDSRFLALSLPSFTPIFLRSMDTSSSHLIFGLYLRLVAYSFPYNLFLGLRCLAFFLYDQAIVNLTMFSTLIMASNSSFHRILHNSFSFTGPYIFRKIFLSNTANAGSSFRLANKPRTGQVSRFATQVMIFIFSTAFTYLEHSQPPIQRIQGFFLWGQVSWGHEAHHLKFISCRG